MIRGLVVKEIREGIYSFKFVLSFVLALLAIPFALFIGAERYKSEIAEYRDAVQQSVEAFRSMSPRPPHSAVHFGLSVTKPPTPLVAFAAGASEVLGNRAELDPHMTPRVEGGTADQTPLLTLFGGLDYAFVIQVIFSLFALLLSFDLVSGEREDGTLKLILSNPVSRSQVILGKLIGGSLVLLVPVAVATVLGLFTLTPAFGIELSGDQWLRVLWIVALSFLFLLMMFLAGLLVSILTRRRILSIIVLLIAWVILLFVVPRMAASIAQWQQPIPPSEEIAGQIRQIRQEEAQKFQQRNREAAESNPLYSLQALPSEVIVANRREMDHAVEARSGQVLEVVEAAKRRQVSLASNLARISPMTAYLLAVTDLAGTGVAQHQHFVSHLEAYRQRFVAYFDELESQGVAQVDDFSQVPMFEYSPQTLADIAPRVLGDVGLILAVCLVLFAAAYAAFLKCDVR